MDEPRVVILVFASGNLVCVGAKNESDVDEAVRKLQARLNEESLISYE